MVISFEERKRQIMQERQKEAQKQAKKQQLRPENVKLTKKQKQKARKRAKRKIVVAGIVAALGITGFVAGTKLLPEGKTNAPAITENENNKQAKTNEFKEKYKVNENDLVKNESEVEKEINELQNGADVLAYLKNMYIEKYEEKTGDETLTTDDIKIMQNSQNYVYVDSQTGDIITHGEIPGETEKALTENNISYDIKNNVETYQVQNLEGQTIDMITMENRDGQTVPIKVIPGNQYNEMKDYDSILDEMGTIIPDGIEYMSNFENENAKDKFISAIEKVQSQQQKQNKQIEDDGMELE